MGRLIKLRYFYPLPWMMCDVLPRAPIIHTCVEDIPLDSLLSACVRFYHYTNNQQGDSIHTCPQGCAMGRWMKTSTFLAPLALSGVQCTMRSNHQYRCRHPSQSTNGYIYKVCLPLMGSHLRSHTHDHSSYSRQFSVQVGISMQSSLLHKNKKMENRHCDRVCTYLCNRYLPRQVGRYTPHDASTTGRKLGHRP